MIPTIVIVNDENESLNKLALALSTLARVIKRTSFQGEQLYNVFEGILFFDQKGQQQLKRKDDYSDVIPTILSKLKELDTPSKMLLKKYLMEQTPNRTFSSSIKNSLGVEAKRALEEFLQEMYESDESEQNQQ